MRFYLVQRLERRSNAFRDLVGFDRYFGLEYMGSSEFEWGAIPKALKSMRTSPVEHQAVNVTIDGVTRAVHIVTHKSKHQQAADELAAWANGRGNRPPFWGKEMTHFDFQFAGIERPYDTTTAWWSIEDDVAFALDEDNAAALVDAFNSKPVS